MKKTASIIIPTYNRAHLVSKAIECALKQTYPCEVIVCDHGSSDNTSEIVGKYGNDIRYIRKNEDNGPIVCWRDGLENSRGEIINFNYDDDWMEPTFMEKSIALLNDDVGFVYSRAMIHHDSDYRVISCLHPSYVNSMNDMILYLLKIPFTLSPSCAIFRRKDAIKNLLPYIPGAKGKFAKNSGVGEDTLLFLLTSLDYDKYAHLPEPLINFLAHDDSITMNSINTNSGNELVEAYTHTKNYFISLNPKITYNSVSEARRCKNIIFWVSWYLRTPSLIRSILFNLVHFPKKNILKKLCIRK